MLSQFCLKSRLNAAEPKHNLFVWWATEFVGSYSSWWSSSRWLVFWVFSHYRRERKLSPKLAIWEVKLSSHRRTKWRSFYDWFGGLRRSYTGRCLFLGIRFWWVSNLPFDLFLTLIKLKCHPLRIWKQLWEDQVLGPNAKEAREWGVTVSRTSNKLSRMCVTMTPISWTMYRSPPLS